MPVVPLLHDVEPQMEEQLLDVLASHDLQVPEQGIEVPKIILEDIPSRRSCREPQLAEQLAEVLTILYLHKQTFDTPVPRRGGVDGFSLSPCARCSPLKSGQYFYESMCWNLRDDQGIFRRSVRHFSASSSELIDARRDRVMPIHLGILWSCTSCLRARVRNNHNNHNTPPMAGPLVVGGGAHGPTFTGTDVKPGASQGSAGAACWSDDGRHSLASCCPEDSTVWSRLLRESDPRTRGPQSPV